MLLHYKYKFVWVHSVNWWTFSHILNFGPTVGTAPRCGEVFTFSYPARKGKRWFNMSNIMTKTCLLKWLRKKPHWGPINTLLISVLFCFYQSRFRGHFGPNPHHPPISGRSFITRQTSELAVAHWWCINQIKRKAPDWSLFWMCSSLCSNTERWILM